MLETSETNWIIVRNAIRKRLKNFADINGLELDDLTQDGCGFAHYEIEEKETPVGIAIMRSVGRVKNRHKYVTRNDYADLIGSSYEFEDWQDTRLKTAEYYLQRYGRYSPDLAECSQ